MTPTHYGKVATMPKTSSMSDLRAMLLLYRLSLANYVACFVFFRFFLGFRACSSALLAL